MRSKRFNPSYAKDVDFSNAEGPGAFSNAEGDATPTWAKVFPIVGLAGGILIAIEVNKKKKWGWKGIVGGAVLGSFILGLPQTFFVLKPHFEKPKQVAAPAPAATTQK